VVAAENLAGIKWLGCGQILQDVWTTLLATRPTPKCYFVLGFPSESLEILIVGTLATLGAHNFVCKPSIEMKFEAKL
jgi:hypothetical protein